MVRWTSHQFWTLAAVPPRVQRRVPPGMAVAAFHGRAAAGCLTCPPYPPTPCPTPTTPPPCPTATPTPRPPPHPLHCPTTYPAGIAYLPTPLPAPHTTPLPATLPTPPLPPPRHSASHASMRIRRRFGWRGPGGLDQNMDWSHFLFTTAAMRISLAAHAGCVAAPRCWLPHLLDLQSPLQYLMSGKRTLNGVTVVGGGDPRCSRKILA